MNTNYHRPYLRPFLQGRVWGRVLLFFTLHFALFNFTACDGNKMNHADEEGDTIPLRYARNLTIVEYPKYTQVTIRNPWDTSRVLNSYTLVKEKQGLKGEIVVPLGKVGVFTSVHCSLLMELGCQDCIGGICELEYIHIPYVHKGVEDGRIIDLGNGMEPNLERIMNLRPDAIMLSPFENSGGYGRLERMGIPLVECAEYMENSPLSRAEWIRFYGRLFDKAELADSLFLQIEQSYLELREAASKAQQKPRLICETPQSGYWYVPGGKSTMGIMYRDAGANYLFSDIEGSGSTAISIERVMDRALTAQVWLIKHHGPLSKEQIVQDVPALRNVSANIFLCDTFCSGFYEETPFHPDVLLRNLIHILHPELGIKEEKAYFCPLE